MADQLKHNPLAYLCSYRGPLLITVGIVNWNGKKYLRQCLAHLLAQDPPLGSLKIVLLDNGSSDRSIEEVRDVINANGITVIMAGTNLGFSAGHNRIILGSDTEFYMPLNFDVFLEPNYISCILAEMAQDETIGMATGKLRKMVNFAPQMVLDSTGIQMPAYWPRARGETEEDVGQYDGPDCRRIFGPCGAAPVYRRKMLEDVRYKDEYFDEHFVNYVEDVDLAWRAQLRGWKGIYVPLAVAYHERGATRKNNSSEQSAYILVGYRNRYLALYKNITRYEVTLYGWKMLVRELLFILDSRAGGVSRRVKLRAVLNAYRARDSIRPKRQAVQQGVQIRDTELLEYFAYRDFSIICFISGKLFDSARRAIHVSLLKLYRLLLKAYRIISRLCRLPLRLIRFIWRDLLP